MMNILGENYQYNIKQIQNIREFADFVPMDNEVCFVQMMGAYTEYLKDIEYMDDMLGKQAQQEKVIYCRVNGLSKLTDYSDVNYYSEVFNKWKSDRRFSLKSDNDMALSNRLGEICCEIEQMFISCTPNVTESITKNFIIKFMYWMDNVKDLLIKNANKNCKFVINNISKKPEYLFCYALTRMGINVMILLPDTTMDAVEHIDAKVKKINLGPYNKINIPEYRKNDSLNNNSATTGIVLERINRTTPRREPAPVVSVAEPVRELAFEELAQLASSVVMIAAVDDSGKVISTGSGIMIGKKGYILTNNHVACGGATYAVRIEDDDNTYETNGVIKYNQHLDLAVIRINRELKPLPIYNREKTLVRGQKVVAIGSPLGLFNSVSDGIISGFRKMRDDVEMIQFTAPISHGSSGGAVLNMYGEVIGISTAGIDEGQNLNLAVGYSDIYNFVKGFI